MGLKQQRSLEEFEKKKTQGNKKCASSLDFIKLCIPGRISLRMRNGNFTFVSVYVVTVHGIDLLSSAH